MVESSLIEFRKDKPEESRFFLGHPSMSRLDSIQNREPGIYSSGASQYGLERSREKRYSENSTFWGIPVRGRCVLRLRVGPSGL